MSTFAEAIAATIAMGLLGSLFFLTPLWAPDFVFLTVVQETRPLPESGFPQFDVADGFVLVAFVAIASAAVAILPDGMSATGPMLSVAWRIGMAVGVNLLVFATWVKCLQFMHGCRIHAPWPRMLFQIVLFPTSVVAVAEILAGTIVLLLLPPKFEPVDSGLDLRVVGLACVIGLSTTALFVVRFLFKRLVLPDTAGPADTAPDQRP